MIKHFQKWKKVRMIGSAAIANLYVATGRADCYEEKDTFIWDIAAGSIIVEEAGGVAIISDVSNDYRLMQNLQTENLTNLLKSICYEWISLAKV